MEGHGDSPDSQCDVFWLEDSHGNLWSYGVKGGDTLSLYVEETVMKCMNEACYSCHHATVMKEGSDVKEAVLTKFSPLAHCEGLYRVRGALFVFSGSEEKLKMIVERMNRMICKREEYNIIYF